MENQIKIEQLNTNCTLSNHNGYEYPVRKIEKEIVYLSCPSGIERPFTQEEINREFTSCYDYSKWGR